MSSSGGIFRQHDRTRSKSTFRAVAYRYFSPTLKSNYELAAGRIMPLIVEIASGFPENDSGGIDQVRPQFVPSDIFERNIHIFKVGFPVLTGEQTCYAHFFFLYEICWNLANEIRSAKTPDTAPLALGTMLHRTA
jgi:hypothetical protein